LQHAIAYFDRLSICADSPQRKPRRPDLLVLHGQRFSEHRESFLPARKGLLVLPGRAIEQALQGEGGSEKIGFEIRAVEVGDRSCDRTTGSGVSVLDALS
jgi:hypothetical protein